MTDPRERRELEELILLFLREKFNVVATGHERSVHASYDHTRRIAHISMIGRVDFPITELAERIADNFETALTVARGPYGTQPQPRKETP